MGKWLHNKRWLILLVVCVFGAAAWAGNRMDFFGIDLGDEEDPLDDLNTVEHSFISEDFQPFRMYLYVDEGNNVISPISNVNLVTMFEALEACNMAVEAWNDVDISFFEFEESIVPFSHDTPIYPNQTLFPGAAGLDGYNLITFQDLFSLSIYGFNGDPGIVSATALVFKFWRDFELDSFINLPSGVLMAEPIDPWGGGVQPGDPPQLQLPQLLVDFNQDGFSDILIEARDYEAGETFEADVWFDPSLPWVAWPQDPADLDAVSTGGTPITRRDTLGTADIQAILTHELGHALGITHSNLERATMYYLVKQGYDDGFLFPTDIWEMRELDVDDEMVLGLVYPDSDGTRGTIAGRVLDGRNFDGVRDDETSGVIDAILYGTVYLGREMTTGTIPAYVADKAIKTTSTAVSQNDLDTSPVLWVELLAEVQTGNDIVLATWPNPLAFEVPFGDVNGIDAHTEASPDFVMPAVPPFDQYVLWLDASGLYQNDSDGVDTDNISLPFDFFLGYQQIPTEFYGGSMDPVERRFLGPDSPTSLTVTTSTTQIVTQTGDDPTSFVYVSVQAGRVTGGIDIYTNTGGLPAGVTPTPFPGASPTPSPLGQTTFTPDVFSDVFMPTESEWGLACAIGDVDRDGDMDVYVCNGVSAATSGAAVSMVNRILINQVYTIQPDGSLKYNGPTAGFRDLTFGEDGIAGTFDDRLPFDIDLSFGAIIGDFNLDSWPDIYVSNTESLSQGTVGGAQNRLYVNRGGVNPAQGGFFDDATAWLRTDAAIGIPLEITETVLPGILNQGPFLYGDLSTKSAAGDIDSDGDLDIVVSEFGVDGSALSYGSGAVALGNVFSFLTPDIVRFADQMVTLSYSERILINHANDFDPNTRGFYFTDETLGLDLIAQDPDFPLPELDPFLSKVAWGEWTLDTSLDALRIAADRMPPVFPKFKNINANQFGNQGDDSMTYEVVLGPIIGDGSCDMFLVNRSGGVQAKSGINVVLENADIDGDAIADGYYRHVNFGWDYPYLFQAAFDGTSIPVTLPNGAQTTFPLPNSLEVSLFFGIGGITLEQGDPGDINNEDNTLAPNITDSVGGGIIDTNYHRVPQLLSAHGVGGHTLYDLATPIGGGEMEVKYGEATAGNLFGGVGISYMTEFLWAFNPQWTYAESTPLQMQAGFARGFAIADFDNDGDKDVYVPYSSDRDEDVAGGVPIPNEYFVNDRFGNFTNVTLTATSGTARGTYFAEPFDYDLDGDIDIFLCNAAEANGILINNLYLAPPNLSDPTDNPMFVDATPDFLPAFYRPNTNPPFSGSALGNLTVNSVAGDLTGDGFPEIIEANGALFTGAGDSTMYYINHGAPVTGGTTVFTPVGATYPGPRIPSPGDLLTFTFASAGSGSAAPYLTAATAAYDAALIDLDLDADYDVFISTLGAGPLAFANMDSHEMEEWPHEDVQFFPGLRWTDRVLNSRADDDFAGDGIMVPAEMASLVPPTGFAAPIVMPDRILDPGPFSPSQQKKEQNRRLAYADVDSNGAIDVILANGIPVSGAPNALLLNGILGSPPGVLTDATESHLPVTTRSDGQGGTYFEGINDDTMDVAVADFDNDGFPELIFLNTGTGNTSSTRYLDNDGFGHFTDLHAPGSPAATWLIPDFGNRRVTSMVVADFDRKGDPTEDVNGNGVLDSGEDSNRNGVLDFWDTTETEDINGNGVLDFGEDGLAPFDPPNGVLDSADLNGDGVITPRQPGVFDASWDFFIAFVDGPDKLFLNTLPGPAGTDLAFIEVTRTHLPGRFAASYGTDVGDVDLDGDIDIVVAIGTQPTLPHVTILLNNGIGVFTQAVNEIPPNSSIITDLSGGSADYFHETAYDVDLLDVDADGDLDLHLSYIGFSQATQTMGGMNAFYVNRTLGTNFNTLNRFLTYRSPFFVKLSPQVGVQGESVPITIFGQNFDSKILSLSLGDGITVGPITRVGPNAYSTMLQIANLAAPGVRTVVAQFEDGKTCQLPDGFTVIARVTRARPVWDRYE